MPYKKIMIGLGAIVLTGVGIFSWKVFFVTRIYDCSKVPKEANATVIKIENNAFDPSNISARVCDTIMFLNLDDTQHWPKSAIFDAGHGMPKLDYYTFQLNRIGSFEFSDKLNSKILGKVTVNK